MVLSRDVIFQETLRECVDKVSVPLQDAAPENPEQLERPQTDQENEGKSETMTDGDTDGDSDSANEFHSFH